jgi:uncharacterized protein YndB with AHSA1/START domain
MKTDLLARVSIEIKTSQSRVWRALVDPKQIKQYLFGTETISDWEKGSPIIFKGVWQGKEYEDKGKILEIAPEKLLVYTYWSAFSGLPDTSENYATITIKLLTVKNGTKLELTQDNNSTEESRDHSQKNWEQVMGKLKELLEKPN